MLCGRRVCILRKIFIILHTNPQYVVPRRRIDTGCWEVRLNTKGVYLTLYFLALRNDQFLNHSQEWSNSRCPLGTFMYFRLISVRNGLGLLHTLTLRGDSAIAHSTMMGFGRPRRAEWARCGSRFSFISTWYRHYGVDGCEANDPSCKLN